MRKKTGFTTEDVLAFLQELETEGDEQLNDIIEEIQNIELKIREVDYSLQDFEKNEDTNINFFSPVGVYEEREEKGNLLAEAESLKSRLSNFQDKLEKYKYRREYIQYLSKLVKEYDQISKVSDEDNKKAGNRSLHILETQERDRNRIARDLHDSSVQSLTSLVHKTELCMRLMDIDTIRVRLELQTMIETIKTIINGMREIIYDLRPMSLNNLGLSSTVESYCLQMQKNYDILVNYSVDGHESEILSIMKVTLYRILQEACSNIVKHAKASKIDVNLTYEEKCVILKIQDNGIGFDTEKVLLPSREEKLHGFGLTMMNERVTLLGGSLSIDSNQNGTVILVNVPINNEKEKNDGEN